MGAVPCEERAPKGSDLIPLGELGIRIIERLRSADEQKRSKNAKGRRKDPLSTEEIEALEEIVSVIGEATGSRPTLGQVANVILRMHVEELRKAAREPLTEQPLVG